MNDDRLENAGVRYFPWQGANFEADLLHGKKLLVLGDSHYFTDGVESGNSFITRELIEDCISNKGYSFYVNISDLLDEIFTDYLNEPSIKSHAFDVIAYYNYLTSNQLTNGSGGQTSSMYHNSESAMIEVLRELGPTHVLILGRKTWNYFLARTNKDNNIGQTCKPGLEGVDDSFSDLWEYSCNGRNFLVAHMYHPSARGKYSFCNQRSLSKKIISQFLGKKPA